MASYPVALRKESVDRNNRLCQIGKSCINVALRKESVDRNVCPSRRPLHPSMSLSARRAWIEISLDGWDDAAAGSLSARRAWIEIMP